MDHYKTLLVIPDPEKRVAYLKLNRPSHRNALSRDFFSEFPVALAALDLDPDVNAVNLFGFLVFVLLLSNNFSTLHAVVLSGAGDHFCSGIDLATLSSTASVSVSDRSRSSERLRRDIKFLQDAVTAVEACRKPVIAAVHGACIGGGVDIVTACDVRYCSADAFFSVKEVDLAITADLGTLQRLPGIVGYGNAVELALTGRRFSGQEAKELGLVSRVFGSKEELHEGVRIVAEGIASKSPLAVTGTKAVLLKGRDMSIDQGLDYVATWNSAMLVSDDLKEAMSAHLQKRKPLFAKL